MNLTNKVAIVTGGSKGIGAAIYNTLQERGATVVSWSRGEGVDITKLEDVCSAMREVIALHGRVDILVNNAGVFGANKGLSDYSALEFDDVMNVNLRGHFLVTREAIPHMRRQDYGRIVFMSSVVAKDVNPMAPVYSIAKGAMVQMAKAWGRELAKTNIRVNAVTPSPADTALFANTPTEQINAMLAKVPLGRFIGVKEIANLVAWLCSEECSASTGAVFDISGGRSQW